MLQPKLTHVQPLENYMLKLNYETNEEKIFDVKPYLDMPFYKSLKNETLFQTVRITDDGWTLEWANGRDISPHELYNDSFQTK